MLPAEVPQLVALLLCTSQCDVEAPAEHPDPLLQTSLAGFYAWLMTEIPRCC